MPKNQFVDPRELRRRGKICFSDIELNKYSASVEEECKIYSKADFMRIYRDMSLIREFENMLCSIKKDGEYEGIRYNNPGPSHLSIGQEASVVGQAYLLDKDDYTFGSHRSHGEIIAKGLSVIEKLPDDELMSVMKSFMGGRILSVVENNQDNVKSVAVEFLLYGILAEIFAKETGFQAGLAGSMHAFFTPFGIYPNNAIVGGSATIAAGAALYKKINNKPGIVIANIGDGAMGRGPVWEAMNFSAMDQFTKLWDDAHKGGLPIIFNFSDNSYAMGGQTAGETMAYGVLARVGAGVCPSQMHAERIDGYNPLAVIDAIRRKKQIIRENKGPVLLDTITYRTTGHSASDKDSYRTAEELNAWKSIDPIESYKNRLLAAKMASNEEFDAISENNRDVVKRICKIAVDGVISPRMDLKKDPNKIEKMMFSSSRKDESESQKADLICPINDCSRMKKISSKKRFAFDEKGNKLPSKDLYQFRDAVFEAVVHGIAADPTLIVYGEDVRDWGGAYGVYEGLTEVLPYRRLFNSPISESAIIGSAVGYAMAGGSALTEIMYCDFIGCAAEELFNQLAKWQAMSAGQLKMPVVVRVSIGSKYGAQHSQDLTSLCAHIPGLKVVYPATPYDAKGLMNAALAGTDPVIFFESQKLYDTGEMFHVDGVPEEYYEIQIGEPDIKREGSDVTILSIGAALYTAVKAADRLKSEFGVSAEIIDARTIVPFNYEKVLESVRKTGRIVLVSDAVDRGSAIKNIAENITEMAFSDLKAPPVTVGSRNWINPTIELGEHFYPQPEWILDAINDKMFKLNGYVQTADFSVEERVRREKSGL